ncbi:MAG: MFS transporter [Pseudomonadota bacterium]
MAAFDFLKRPPVMVIIIAGCLISLVGFGARSTMGFFLEPMTTTRGWDRETFALAIAIQNLLWGFGVPVAGALADRFGPLIVMTVGSVIYAGGLCLMSVVEMPIALHLTAGVMTGVGVAFTSFSLAMAAMARAVGPERRSLAMGAGASAGSLGQVVLSPLTFALIASYGWEHALIILAGFALLIIPLVLFLPKSRPDTAAAAASELDLSSALAEALRHRGFLLLTAGFFVCGFHVSFIGVHLPAYVQDIGLDASVAAYALSTVGLVNILGAFLGGVLGQHFRKKSVLSVIYLLRGVVITALLFAPVSEITIYAFAVALGFLWLSTVPLTNAIVGQIFGMQWLATLFGIVFVGHQLGSFLGVWLGGYVYDLTGSYDPVWWAGVALALVAAVLHWPINEDPVERLGGAPQPVPAATARDASNAVPGFMIGTGLLMIAAAVAMRLSG